ncbi:hypothetical protein AbraIFM66951_010862 [Aspergillus brasiliensis]|uniref:Uncharacterized protein n=1 Tax=Aspergillus brasiliensis TaxID=319629 RepID=A0A9W5YII6_9EURO|nr:hypothetical protein AbraCBS73388_010051 [Aspergillus brasiliensis]GKZ47495.1 hypothetical protein AbraIFM66951_010862 [Aspergillus brasiliensis]
MLYSSIVARGAVLRGLRGKVTVSVEAAVSVGLAPSQQAEIKKHGWKQQITRAEKPLPTWILRKGEKIETPYTSTCSLFGYYKPEDTRTAYIYVFSHPEVPPVEDDHKAEANGLISFTLPEEASKHDITVGSDRVVGIDVEWAVEYIRNKLMIEFVVKREGEIKWQKMRLPGF